MLYQKLQDTRNKAKSRSLLTQKENQSNFSSLISKESLGKIKKVKKVAIENIDPEFKENVVVTYDAPKPIIFEENKPEILETPIVEIKQEQAIQQIQETYTEKPLLKPVVDDIYLEVSMLEGEITESFNLENTKTITGIIQRNPRKVRVELF